MFRTNKASLVPTVAFSVSIEYREFILTSIESLSLETDVSIGLLMVIVIAAFAQTEDIININESSNRKGVFMVACLTVLKLF
jgi:hypothetical protein